MNEWLIDKKIYLAQQVGKAFVLKKYSLAEFTYLQIRLDLTKSFLGNTKKTDRNNVNEQNTRRKR